MTLYDSSYQHWSGGHRGIWWRRAVIAGTGLRACLKGRWMRYLISCCWALALVQVALIFLLGQLLIPDSIVVRWVGNLNPQLQSLARGLMTWLVDHPEISVKSTYNLSFYFFSTRLLGFAIIAVALAVPYLITRDLAGNAIVIYSSKAISRFDYFLGKFGTLFGVLALAWLGPVCLAWSLGNLLATDWRFFWHSRQALGHSAGFVLIGMVVLSLLGLGVSALSGREKNTVGAWIAFWLIGNALVPIGRDARHWLRYGSFYYDLKQIALSIFTLKDDLQAAQDNLPFFGQMLSGIRERTLWGIEHPEWQVPSMVLGGMALLALVVVMRKVKPE